jgi:hypothetical protein
MRSPVGKSVRKTRGYLEGDGFGIPTREGCDGGKPDLETVSPCESLAVPRSSCVGGRLERVVLERRGLLATP